MTDTARRARRVYQATFCLGAFLSVVSLIAAGLVGTRALVCAGCAFFGGTWMILTLLAASKDETLD